MKKNTVINYILKPFPPLYFLCLFSITSSRAQTAKVLDDQVFVNNIYTVQLFPNGNDQAYPIMEIGSRGALTLMFDDLDAYAKSYSYTLVHCNPDWTPSPVMPNQYLSGYLESLIPRPQMSLNALVKYAHYTVQIPDNTMRPVFSGNYIVKVYPEGNPDEVIFTRRFLIVDPQMEIAARVHQATTPLDRNTRQEVDFTIDFGKYQVMNPQMEIKTVILQNCRWDMALCDLPPQMILPNQLVYNYDSENTFPGNNEFRFLDTRSVRMNGQGVANVSFEDNRCNMTLFPDKPRADLPYSTIPDLNGNFRVNEREKLTNSDLEADYCVVNFALSAPFPYEKADVYLMGKLTDWHMQEWNKMVYSRERNQYELALPIKQGYYNYEYVLNTQDNRPQESIEGNFSNTENDYMILVYHKPMGIRYFKLVGLKQCKSNN